MPSPQTIGTILGQAPGKLHTIARRVNVLRELTGHVRRQLQAPLDQHCEVANIDHQTLLIVADSPAWAMRLRYHIPALLDLFKVQAETRMLRNIRVKVLPRQGAPNPLGRTTQNKLSASATQVLRAAAAAMEEPQLRAALYRLSRHGPSGARNPRQSGTG